MQVHVPLTAIGVYLGSTIIWARGFITKLKDGRDQVVLSCGQIIISHGTSTNNTEFICFSGEQNQYRG